MRTSTRAAASAVAAVAMTVTLLGAAAPAQADTTKTTRAKVCVKVHKDGELTHRYVLIKHVTTTYDDAGQVVGEPDATAWHRVPQRLYPHRWERLCG